MNNKYILKFQQQHKNVAYTIVQKNQIHFGKVLAESFLKYNPDWDFIIYLSDIYHDIEDLIDPIEAFAKGYEFAPIYSIRECLDFEELEEMLSKYDIPKLMMTLKPHVFEYLIAKGYQKLVYLNPKTLVLSSFNEIADELDEYNILLTSHDLNDFSLDIEGLSSLDSFKAELFIQGFTALNNNEESINLIRWWKEPLPKFVISDFQGSRFADNELMNFTSSNFKFIKFLKQKKYNAAFWSLKDKELLLNNNWTIDNDKIVFFNFNAMQFDIRYNVLTTQNRHKAQDIKGLEAINEYYGTQINKKLSELNPGKSNNFDNSSLNGYSSGEKLIISNEYSHLTNGHTKKSDLISLNVVGYFSNILGLAEIARSFVRILCKSGIDFSLLDYFSSYHSVLPDKDLLYFKNFRGEKPISDITLSFINADLIPQVAGMYPEYFNYKYSIGVWWWEIHNYFPFKDSFNYVNRILVCSDFVKESIEPFTDLKISKITYPFYPNWKIITPKDKVRKQLEINDEEFVFIFNFDFFSSISRKNPTQIIDAFSKAFNSHDRVRLIVKSVHGELFNELSNIFSDAIRETKLNNKITWINKDMNRDEWISLLNASDCYVTLHRSEGLGLGILEAMYLGKPVITTAYGGCMDICNKDNSLLVDFTIIPVKDSTTIYKDGQWADPELNSAVNHMRNIANDSDLYKSLSEKAANDVLRYYDPRKTLYELYQVFFEYYGIDIANYIELS